MSAVSGPTTAPSLIQYDVDHSRSFEGIAAALKIAAATKETVAKNDVQQYQAVALVTPGGMHHIVYYAKSDYDAISEHLQSSVATLRSLSAVMELGGNRGDARVLIEGYIHTPEVEDLKTIRKENALPAVHTTLSREQERLVKMLKQFFHTLDYFLEMGLVTEEIVNETAGPLVEFMRNRKALLQEGNFDERTFYPEVARSITDDQLDVINNQFEKIARAHESEVMNRVKKALDNFEISGFKGPVIPDIFWNNKLFAGAKILYILVADLFVPDLEDNIKKAQEQFVDAGVGTNADFEKLLDEAFQSSRAVLNFVPESTDQYMTRVHNFIKKRVKEIIYKKVISALSDPAKRQQILKDVTQRQMVGVIREFLGHLSASKEEFEKRYDLTPYLFLIDEMNTLNPANPLYGLRMVGRPLQETNDYLHAVAALACSVPLPFLSAAASHTQLEEQNMKLARNIEEAIIANLSRLHLHAGYTEETIAFFTERELAFVVARSLGHFDYPSDVSFEDVLSFIPSVMVEMLNHRCVEYLEFAPDDRYATLPQCDFTPLSKVPTLRKLGLQSVRIKDLRFLKDLPNINVVVIGPNFIGNVQDWAAQLAFLKEVRPDLKFTLNVAAKYRVDLRPLINLNNVCSLRFSFWILCEEAVKYEREQREFLEMIRPELFT